MEELPLGIRRVTLPLPTRPGHVHAISSRAATAGRSSTPVSGCRTRRSGGRPSSGAAGPCGGRRRHPLPPRPRRCGRRPPRPHGCAGVSGCARLRAVRARLGQPALAARIIEWFQRHGAPPGVTNELVEQGSVYAPFIRYQPDPVLVEPGEEIDGWEPVAAPGHADGQLCLLRDGVLLAADHVLDPISPTVGLWPASRPDPLGDYLDALERTIALGAASRYPVTGSRSQTPPAARGRSSRTTRAARRRRPAAPPEQQSGYVLSLALFGSTSSRRHDASPSPRRSPTSSASCTRAARRAGSRRRCLLYFCLSGRRAAAQYRRPVCGASTSRDRARAMSDARASSWCSRSCSGTPSSSRPSTRSSPHGAPAWRSARRREPPGAHGAAADGRARPLHLDRSGRDHGVRHRARRDRRAARLAIFDFLPRGVAFVIAFGILTYLRVPRRARAEGCRAAEGRGDRRRAGAAARRLLPRLVPVVWLLQLSANAVLRVLRVKPAPAGMIAFTRDDIRTRSPPRRTSARSRRPRRRCSTTCSTSPTRRRRT